MAEDEDTADTANGALRKALRERLDTRTKPPGSLGRLEEVSERVGLICNSVTPEIRDPVCLVFAADHGAAVHGLSAFPQEVTRQMVANYVNGGAAINVLCRTHGVRLVVVDAGVAGEPIEVDGVISARLGPGTRDYTVEPAIDGVELARAFGAAQRIVEGEMAGGCNVIALGEMGIGNTSAASLIAHKLTGVGLEALVGPGTGLDAAGVARKRALLARAAARTGDMLAPEEALLEYGGFEIAMLTGAILAAAERGAVIVVDGFIVSVAALLAVQIRPAVVAHLIVAHQSAEPGHRVVVERLGAGAPLLDLGLRLGEGTGAVLAIPLVRAAAAILTEMASFADAGVASALS